MTHATHGARIHAAPDTLFFYFTGMGVQPEKTVRIFLENVIPESDADAMEQDCESIGLIDVTGECILDQDGVNPDCAVVTSDGQTFRVRAVSEGTCVLRFHYDGLECDCTVVVRAFTRDQECVFSSAVYGGGDLLVIGRGGTGKTETLKAIRDTFTRFGQKVLVLAPTGRAAENVDGFTIHSKIRTSEYHLLRVNGKGAPYYSTRELRNVDKVIVDEIFLVRCDVFDSLMESIERAEEEYGRHIQVLLFGDGSQLPPVTDETKNERDLLNWSYGRDMKDASFFRGNYWQNYGNSGYSRHERPAGYVIGSDGRRHWTVNGEDGNRTVYAGHRFSVMGMNEIVRTSDEEFKNVLETLRCPDFRSNEAIGKALEFLKQNTAKTPIPGASWLVGTKSQIPMHMGEAPDDAVYIPAKFVTRRDGDETSAPADETAIIDRNGKDDTLLAEHSITVWPGMRVMSSRNDTGTDEEGRLKVPAYRNGSFGTVEGIYRKNGEPVVVVRFDSGNVIEIEMFTAPVLEPGIGKDGASAYSRGLMRYMPLIPGDVFTIHKAQGLTLMNGANIPAVTEIPVNYNYPVDGDDDSWINEDTESDTEDDDGEKRTRVYRITESVGMLYVALSRCRSPQSMYIEGLDRLTVADVRAGSYSAADRFFHPDYDPKKEDAPLKKRRCVQGNVPMALAGALDMVRRKSGVPGVASMAPQVLLKAVSSTFDADEWMKRYLPGKGITDKVLDSLVKTEPSVTSDGTGQEDNGPNAMETSVFTLAPTDPLTPSRRALLGLDSSVTEIDTSTARAVHVELLRAIRKAGGDKDVTDRMRKCADRLLKPVFEPKEKKSRTPKYPVPVMKATYVSLTADEEHDGVDAMKGLLDRLVEIRTFGTDEGESPENVRKNAEDLTGTCARALVALCCYTSMFTESDFWKA